MKNKHKTHPIVVGYLLWIVGFTGAHRFYFDKRITGVIWFFTFGLLGIGWLIDLFLIPSLSRQASKQFTSGEYDYGLAWVLMAYAGFLGVHRFYMGKIGTGILYLLTMGCLGLGVLYDYFTLNSQIEALNIDS